MNWIWKREDQVSDVFPFLQLFFQYNAFIYGASITKLDLHTAQKSIGDLSALHEGQTVGYQLAKKNLK